MLLPRSFYNRPTLEVAQELLGKRLRFFAHDFLITETEAYIGQNDPACHAARGLTPRTRVMFGPPGHAYIYFIYGMYHCLNIVTEEEGFPAAVLIRGLVSPHVPYAQTNGPGKLCRFLGLDLRYNAWDLTQGQDFFMEEGVHVLHHDQTPRIGIREGQDHLWRFVVPRNGVAQLFKTDKT